MPGANGAGAAVQVQELGPVGTGVDPSGVGNEVLAHADNLAADTAHPATITLRFSQADVMGTPLDRGPGRAHRRRPAAMYCCPTASTAPARRAL